MSYEYNTLWSKTTPTKKLIAEYLLEYGHFLKWKDSKENVLEIGCAEGSLTRNVLYPYIKNNVDQLVATDKLKDMIELAKQKNHEEKIKFHVMDSMNQKEVHKMTGKFDHVFALYVAHWVPNNRFLLNGIYKMLQSNGQVFMTIMVNHATSESFEKHLNEGTWSRYLRNERFLVDYTDDPVNFFRNLMEDVGFKVDVCERQQGTHITKNFPDMVRALVLMSRSMNLIPKELQESYIQDHIKNSCENSKYLGEPDVYEVPYDSMLCIASKNI